MRRALLALALLVASYGSAQESASASVNYYRTNEPRYEHRVNIVPHAQLGKAFYGGDIILNESLGGSYILKRQIKTLVGYNLLGGFSARFQNDDLSDDRVVAGKMKNKSFNENRYGVGYKISNTLAGVTFTNDLMYLKSDIADRRTEWNLGIASKHFQIRHQIWYDYRGGHVSGWYEKLIVGYKIRPQVQVQWRSEWQPAKKRVDMVGVGMQF